MYLDMLLCKYTSCLGASLSLRLVLASRSRKLFSKHRTLELSNLTSLYLQSTFNASFPVNYYQEILNNMLLAPKYISRAVALEKLPRRIVLLSIVSFNFYDLPGASTIDVFMNDYWRVYCERQKEWEMWLGKTNFSEN